MMEVIVTPKHWTTDILQSAVSHMAATFITTSSATLNPHIRFRFHDKFCRDLLRHPVRARNSYHYCHNSNSLTHKFICATVGAVFGWRDKSVDLRLAAINCNYFYPLFKHASGFVIKTRRRVE